MVELSKANIVLLFLIFSTTVFAQKRELQFSHLTSQDGLGSNTVFAILQDSKGFLWIGTWDGLCRYDGYNFKVYTTNENDSTTISDNKIRTMCESENGDLWIGTWYNGLNKYDAKTEKFTRYLYDEQNPSSISDNNITCLWEDKSDHLWVGTLSGLNKFDLKSQTFAHFIHDPDNPESLSDNSVYSICEERYGLLWIGTAKGGLNLFDKEKETFKYYKYNPVNSKSLSGNWIMSLLEDHSGDLYIGTASSGLNKFEKRSEEFFRYSSVTNQTNCSNEVWDLFEDSDRTLWIGTNNGGLSILDRESGVFSCFMQNSDDPRSLSDNTITSIYEDRTGILWLGTWNGGLNKYNKYEKKFITFSHESNDPNSLSTNSIYPIYVDSFGDLWIGTDIGGINRRVKDTNKFEQFVNNSNNPYSISSNVIYSICEDSIGNIWVATDFGGLSKFDREKKRFLHFRHNPQNPSSILSDRVSQVFIDNRGDLWIGYSIDGLSKLPVGKSEFIHYRHDPANPKSISSGMVFAVNEDKYGGLWFGTNGGGLNKFNRKSKEFIHYNNDPDDPLSLSNDEVSVIQIASNGIMWIGTSGGGLNKFDKDSETFQRYKTDDGLPSDMICGILEDGKGNLWISSFKGLSKFNPETETFRNFSSADGLAGDEFNTWSYFKDKNGTMYFGGTNGLNVFHPDSLNDNPFLPSVVITDFQILHKPVAVGYDPLWDRTILENSLSETDTLELNHYENIITFEFASLDFRNPVRNQYAYFLDGFDKEWTYTDAKNRYATYTNLDPGEYVFRVIGSNNDGLWNKEGNSIAIFINPPWWSTWWAYMLYGAVLVLLVVSMRGYDLRRQRLKHQLELEHEHAEKLQEVDRMKSHFFANISHEFRTPLTLILGPAERIISECPNESLTRQANMIKKNANRLLGLINQLLELSKLESGKLKFSASRNNICSFVKGIAMSFESIAESKDIVLKVILEKEEIPVYFDKEKMEQIIINVISNAFKFTHEGGKISVRVKENENYTADITVRDTGIGIPQKEIPKIFDRFYQVDGTHTREHEGTGIGMALTKELVELHKGEIEIDSAVGEWTEVRITLPLGKSHLTEDEIIEKDETHHQIGSRNEDQIEIAMTDEIPERERLDDRTIILIVEDNSELRGYVKEAISMDYHVEEAMNGEQGLRKAEKLIPDLIISDIMMPVMDGKEMTKRLKTDEKTSHIPIIHLTAKSDQESKIEGLESGADAYVTKPFSIQELQVRIKTLIESRRKLQEKFSKGEILAKPEVKKLSKLDQNYMTRLLEVVNSNLSKEEFSIEEIGEEVGMSRSQIYRKLKAITGKSPSLFLRSVRLTKAKEMIQNKEATISEISFKVGFSSPAYFSRCFKEEYGYSPSDLNL